MLALFLTLAAADDVSDVAMARYRTMTRAERGCVFAPNDADLTICGRRQADRFRVSFVGRAEGDETDNVPYERAQMIRRRTPIEERGPFLVGGGMVGVTARTRSGVKGFRPRDLAP